MPSRTREVAWARAARAVQPSMHGPSDPAAVPKPVTKWSINHSESKLLSRSSSCQTSRRSGQEMPDWVGTAPNLMLGISFSLLRTSPPGPLSDFREGEMAAGRIGATTSVGLASLRCLFLDQVDERLHDLRGAGQVEAAVHEGARVDHAEVAHRHVHGAVPEGAVHELA